MFKVKGSVNGFVLRWWSLPRFYHTMESEYNIAKTTNLWTTAEPFQHNLMLIKICYSGNLARDRAPLRMENKQK